MVGRVGKMKNFKNKKKRRGGLCGRETDRGGSCVPELTTIATIVNMYKYLIWSFEMNEAGARKLCYVCDIYIIYRVIYISPLICLLFNWHQPETISKYICFFLLNIIKDSLAMSYFDTGRSTTVSVIISTKSSCDTMGFGSTFSDRGVRLKSALAVLISCGGGDCTKLG